MKILDEKSKIDEFGDDVAGFRAEVKVETDDGKIVYAYANQVGDFDSYALAAESIMDAIDKTGEDNVRRIEEFTNFKDARNSKYWEMIQYADNLVGAAMDDYYAEEV